MLNALEKLLDVYCNYDFMNSRQNFPNTWVHKTLGRTNKSRFISSFLCVCILVPGTGRWARHTVGIQGGLVAGLPQPWVRPCWGACPGPWCPRWAGLAVRDCSQAAMWGPTHCGAHCARPAAMSISVLYIRYSCVMHLFAVHLNHAFFLRVPSGLTSL